MKLADFLGVPTPVTVGGTELLLSPLTLGDMAILASAAERFVVDDARRRARAERELAGDLSGGLDVAAADSIITDALSVVRSGDAEAKYLQTPQGMMHVLSLSLGHKHEELNAEAVGRLIPYAAAPALERKVYEISFGRSDAGADRPNDVAPGMTGAAADDADWLAGLAVRLVRDFGIMPKDVAGMTVIQALAVIGAIAPDEPPAPAAELAPPPAKFAAAKRDAAFRRAAELAGMTPRQYAALDGATAALWLEQATGTNYPPDKVAARLSEWAETLTE